MTRKRLYQRIRRRLLGAKVDISIYQDGTSRLRVDHPTNDPGTEIAIAGLIIREVRAKGLDIKPSGPVTWRDDP